MIRKYGIEHCGIIIGSSNVTPNPRTPFTFTDRKNFVQKLFPEIKIFEIPDVEAHLESQRLETLQIWLKSLKNMEKQNDEEWIFCGGSEQDLSDVAKNFQTEILVDREIEGERISGTNIRKLLAEKNYVEMKKYVPEPIYKDIIENYSTTS